MKKCVMLQNKNFYFVLLSLFAYTHLNAGRAAQWLSYKKGDFLFDFKVDHKSEAFYVKNGDFLSGNQLDQYLYAQTTWDFTSHARFGDSINSKMALRERARWGQTHAIFTTAETLKLSDISLDEHQHGFNYLVPWFRKVWVKFSLNDAFNIPTEGRHYLKCGIFPFELGRGIALGSAYATAPGMLGFFTDNTIDQYAPGLQLHGDISTQYKIEYDAYVAMLRNLFSAVARNTDPIYTNCYGCSSKYRGVGAVSYVLAGRLLWTIFDTSAFGSLIAEPYALFYNDSENKIEYRGDGAVQLGTYGFAVEYTGSRFELGFEAAANAGHQCVKTWDRNYIIANRNTTTAAVEEVYSNVYAVPTGSTFSLSSDKAQVTNTNKTVVESASAGSNFNGEVIGVGNIVTVAGSTACTLYNGEHRFRPSYKNLFGGCMCVLDGTYWIQPKELKVTATLGFASGDEHPNLILERAEDTEFTDTYSGFIGLQEIYSGSRVRSMFVLGQRVPRPLTAPSASLDPALQHYAYNVSGFTNLVYTGMGLTWTPTGFKRKIKVNPNMLYYWQDCPAKKYCLASAVTTVNGQKIGGDTLDENARRALGLEINTLAEISWLDNLKGYVALAVFVPGPHYKDIIGKPINLNQYKEVIRTDRSGGIDYNSYPLVNNKTAFALNFGFEYLF